MEPRGIPKRNQPKEHHEIADCPTDMRSVLLGGGFLFVARRIFHGHSRACRSGRIG
jgi:hypothetical protein